MPSLLENLSAGLRDGPRSAEILGDTITYTPSGGSAQDILGMVEFDEEMAVGGHGAVATQSIEVEIDLEFRAARPLDADRLQFPNVPSLAGRTFKPVNIRRNHTGDAWVFGVERVNV